MKPVQDITNTRFGRLVAQRRVPRPAHYKNTSQYWLCLCDCGNEITTQKCALVSGRSKSCGCLFRDLNIKKMQHIHANGLNIRKGNNNGYFKHGESKSPEYLIWIQAKCRCRNPKNKRYSYYGGRGIVFDERWDTFSTFLSDMGQRPSDKHSLDRINNDGPYSRENCRWTTGTIQRRNSRSFVHPLTFNGRTMLIVDWAKELGFSRCVIKSRLQRGWSVEATLTTPKRSV